MANFECKVVRIDSKENHPNADRLTLYHIGGYTCISNKLEDGSDRYNVGDLVVYIPENALLPEWLLKIMGFWDKEKHCGTLAGKDGNRVRPLKLRGIYSEGVLYPTETIKEHDEGLNPDLPEAYGYTKDTKFVFNEQSEYVRFTPSVEGDNLAEFLGITKYEPPIPANMGGDVFNGGTEIVVPFDVEPLQKYMDSFKDGEMVEFSEKLHGIQTRFTFAKNEINDEAFGKDHNVYISSKGLGDKGLFFKNNETNVNSYYVRAFKENDIEEKVVNSDLYKENDMITLYGETIGMQDMKYGLANGQIGFRLFDVYVGKPRLGRFLNYEECKAFAKNIGVERVPSLYVGSFSMEKVKEYTDGKTTYGTNLNQIREGIVIRPLNERFEEGLGRVMLKSVSEAYKLRKGKTTEYN